MKKIGLLFLSLSLWTSCVKDNPQEPKNEETEQTQQIEQTPELPKKGIKKT